MLFLYINNQQYLHIKVVHIPWQKESLHQLLAGHHFSKDKFRLIFQKLEIKESSGFLKSQKHSTTR